MVQFGYDVALTRRRSGVQIPVGPYPLMGLKYGSQHREILKISIDDVNKRGDPYQLMIDSIKSPLTLQRYRNLLNKFLEAIPKELFKQTLGKVPRNKKPATLADFFVQLAKKDTELATNIIATYIKAKRKLVEEKKMSSQTLPNYLKPIKSLLDANGVPIHWKSINKLLPRRESSVNDRAYTKEEIQKMMQVAHDITDKLIILLYSSGGFRLEAWDHFTWKDIIPFKEKDGSYKGAALLVYKGDPEAYFTFITPEACKMLDLYQERWKKDIGSYPKPDDPLIKTVRFPYVHRLNAKGVRKRVDIIVKAIGLRPTLLPGKRRHEVQLDHGFRKYFNTMMRRAKVNYLDKEDMMGHKVGLERHYERYQEEDFERFPEYQKAIPFLTISDEERLRIENKQKQEQLDEIAKKDIQLEEISRRLDRVESGKHARNNEYYKTMLDLELQGNSGVGLLATYVKLMFEMSYTEDEKREIWKQVTEKGGNVFALTPLLENKMPSLKNLHSVSTS